MDTGRLRPFVGSGRLQAGLTRTLTRVEPRAEQYPPGEVQPPQFEELWRRESLTLEDLAGERSLVAWRIVRHIARLRGLCKDDQFLYEATKLSPSPWTTPIGTFEGAPIIATGGVLPELSLLPPDVPEDWRDGNTTRVGYRPSEHDSALLLWIEGCERAAHQLCIGERMEDFYALHPILDPDLCRASFPAPEHLLLQEQVVVEDCLSIYLEKGLQGLIREARLKHGLTRAEVLSIYQLIGRAAVTRTTRNDETNYALMVLRLEEIASKARGLMDLRAELAALKNLAIIQGLASQGDDDDVRDITESVRDVAARRTNIVSKARLGAPRKAE